ncbi:hypothetical protein J6590_014397 [Homalodisca vitripennis]|nr:hypothetical protein J6590_014397 [Homalodisca vitripennis]
MRGTSGPLRLKLPHWDTHVLLELLRHERYFCVGNVRYKRALATETASLGHTRSAGTAKT